MGLGVALEEGRTACAESVEAFVRAAEGFSEHDLLGASRCHGWTRLDVVVHMIAGWYDMLGGLVSPVDSEPTVDAATYWPAFATAYHADDPVPALMSQRRRSAAYVRPASATEQLRDVADAVTRGVTACGGGPLLWQGHVFTTGDFLAVWAVEHVVHHLDLRSDEPAPASALRLARASVESLVGDPLPVTWTDVEVALIGSGRSPVPVVAGALADRLPALG